MSLTEHQTQLRTLHWVVYSVLRIHDILADYLQPLSDAECSIIG